MKLKTGEESVERRHSTKPIGCIPAQIILRQGCGEYVYNHCVTCGQFVYEFIKTLSKPGFVLVIQSIAGKFTEHPLLKTPPETCLASFSTNSQESSSQQGILFIFLFKLLL
jgi:hypothetical protein